MHGYKVIKSTDGARKFGVDCRKSWLLTETNHGLQIVVLFCVTHCIPARREIDIRG